MRNKDLQTSDTIKKVARELFREKGFKQTTTRDIATKSGHNLALVNYYFGSKEKLFKEIMMETVLDFFSQLKAVLNEEKTFEEKIEDVISNYFKLLTHQPDLPIFLLSEMRTNPKEFNERMGLSNAIKSSSFYKELDQRTTDGINPIQMFINLLALTVFPFAAKPMIMMLTDSNEDQFEAFMEQRKPLIRLWFTSILKATKS